MKKLIALLLVGASLACAQEPPKHSKKQIALLAVSIGFNVLGTYLDMKSSLDFDGRVAPGGFYIVEGNSLYRSGADRGFHARGVVNIWAITGGISALEYWTWHTNSPLEGVPLGFNLMDGIEHYWGWRHNRNLIKAGEQWQAQQ